MDCTHPQYQPHRGNPNMTHNFAMHSLASWQDRRIICNENAYLGVNGLPNMGEMRS